MKKKNIIFNLIIVIAIVFSVSITSIKIYKFYDDEFSPLSVIKSWGILLPEYENKETILNTTGGFHGDGESFIVLEYSEKNINLIKANLKLTNEDYDVRKTINNFKDKVENTNSKEVPGKKDVFAKFKELDDKTLYLLSKAKNNDTDYAILILPDKSNLIYIVKSSM